MPILFGTKCTNRLREMRTKEGVHNPENFANVLYRWPRVLNRQAPYMNTCYSVSHSHLPFHCASKQRAWKRSEALVGRNPIICDCSLSFMPCTAAVASDISRLPTFSDKPVSWVAVGAIIVKEKMSGKDVPNWAKALDWSKMVMNKENKKEVCIVRMR